MPDLITLRKKWNANQKQLRPLLTQPKRTQEAIKLFLEQHAVLHSEQITGESHWSYEDLLLNDLPEEAFRCLHPREDHTIAWHFWHISRIEDITMNILIAGEDQILDSQGWQGKLNIQARDTGNSMSRAEIMALSNSIDFKALRDYRLAVGKETRRIVQQIQPEKILNKVDPIRLQNILKVSAVRSDSIGLIEYWGNRTIGGLLGMPPSRHIMIHLNQAYSLKQKLTK